MYLWKWLLVMRERETFVSKRWGQGLVRRQMLTCRWRARAGGAGARDGLLSGAVLCYGTPIGGAGKLVMAVMGVGTEALLTRCDNLLA